MVTHEIENALFGVVPFVSLVLKGDYTNIINPKDTIKTSMVEYRVDSLSFDKDIDKTIILVREIVT